MNRSPLTTAAVFELHRFDPAIRAAQLHVDDLAVGALHAARFGEAAQIGRIQRGVELEGVAERR